MEFDKLGRKPGKPLEWNERRTLRGTAREIDCTPEAIAGGIIARVHKTRELTLWVPTVREGEGVHLSTQYPMFSKPGDGSKAEGLWVGGCGAAWRSHRIILPPVSQLAEGPDCIKEAWELLGMACDHEGFGSARIWRFDSANADGSFMSVEAAGEPRGSELHLNALGNSGEAEHFKMIANRLKALAPWIRALNERAKVATEAQ